MVSKEINITHEALFDALRVEKNKLDIQPLDQAFYYQVADYINKKKQYLNDYKGSEIEKEKLTKELHNIKRIISNIYYRRIKKILNIALDINYAPDTIIEKRSLLPEEKKLFDEINLSLEKFGNKLINNIQSGKNPDFEKPAPKLQKPQSSEQNKIKVRFLKKIPKIIGSDLVHYGPFDENDIAVIPTEIAKILEKDNSIKNIQA